MNPAFDNTSSDIDDAQLRDWLLHRLPTSATDRLETRLLCDDALSAALLDVEYGLFDAFARGELAPDDSAAVSAYLLPGTTGRERLRFARAFVEFERTLAAKASAILPQSVPHAIGRRRWYIAMLAAACMLVAFTMGGIWLQVQPGLVTPQAMPTITLLADLSRGAGGVRASVAEAATVVRLQLEVLPERDDEIYRMTIGEGSDRHIVDGLVARRTGAYTFVEAVVPAAVLAAGTNHIILIGLGGSDAAAQQWTLEVRKDR